MLDRHAVQELVRAKVTAREIATQYGVSVRTVRRILREEEVQTGNDADARRTRAIGRPRVTEAIRLAATRATIPAALLVRFEGVAGEFAQFDFGQVSVRLTDGSRRTVHFAAYRLKYSRWIHVVIVPNERGAACFVLTRRASRPGYRRVDGGIHRLSAAGGRRARLLRRCGVWAARRQNSARSPRGGPRPNEHSKRAARSVA